ncbi:MAG: hypothetical protein KF830_13325 [Planctomycetes bacterium]|nr:hypothetical protein [Planctomycetota bacterium]
MIARPLALLLAALVLLPGCNNRRNRSDLPVLVAASVLGGGRVALDPLAATAVLGALLLQNTLPAGTADGDIRFQIEAPPGVGVAEDEVFLAPGQQRSIPVLTTTVTQAVLLLTVVATYVRGGLERQFPIEWRNAAANSSALALVELLAQTQLAALWFTNFFLAATGLPTRNSNPAVPERIPAAAQEIRSYGALLVLLTLVQLQAAFSGPFAFDGTDGVPTFPIGDGPEGFTVAADPAADLAAGEHCLFWLSTEAAIPLADPTQRFQYAFVVDTDTAPGNNFVPATSFPDDFFGGTDRWYELDYDPSNGWRLRCRVVGLGNSITTVPSAARAILSGDTLLLVVPRSEFVVANPPFRATTFAHLGDFGQNPPFTWSGDPTPPVAAGLQSWQ